MNLKMEGLRRLYGAAEPIRRGMEISLCIVSARGGGCVGKVLMEIQDYKPIQLGGPSNLHKDILENRDMSIDWEDIYTGAWWGCGVGVCGVG